MRHITDHIVSGDQAVQLTVIASDHPGADGANHKYEITSTDGRVWEFLEFQDGPIKEVGVNGITGEALIAIEIDRLRSFQNGPFKCRENAIALTHFEEGLMWLQRRTVERIKRGVEGTHQI